MLAALSASCRQDCDHGQRRCRNDESGIQLDEHDEIRATHEDSQHSEADLTGLLSSAIIRGQTHETATVAPQRRKRLNRGMMAKRVIPCLDVHGGQVTRGVQFGRAEAGELRNVGDQVELALRYDQQGADEMVFFDITASAHGRETMVEVIRRTADQVFMPLTVGGGIRSVDDVQLMLRAGADKVSINSSALANPELIHQGAEKFGSQCIVVSIDAKKTAPDRWQVFSHGGRKPTGLDAVEWALRAVSLGAGEIVLNSIDADGTKAGFDLVITRRVSEAVGVPVVASGGAGNLDHMAEVLLEGKADAVLAASIFHFGQHTVGDVKRHLAQKGIPVRLV